VTVLVRILLLILTVKKFENRSIFDEVKAYKKCANYWATLYSIHAAGNRPV